jgi:hypothetical protein
MLKDQFCPAIGPLTGVGMILRGCYEDVAVGVDPATGHELMIVLPWLRPSSETREIVKTQDFLYELGPFA